MTRDQLEHIIRAAASITKVADIIVVGSQSILGRYPGAPAVLRVSTEADVYPRDHPELADVIDGSIGELSPFHETFGYYAQGVDERTATLPARWAERLVPICTPGTAGATGWCLEPHDLAISKLIAGRDKDLRFCHDAAAHGLLDRLVLDERLAATAGLGGAQRTLVAERVEALFTAR